MVKPNIHNFGMKKMWNGLLYPSFVAIKVDPCLFMYKTVFLWHIWTIEYFGKDRNLILIQS